MGKCNTAGQATDNNNATRIVCWIPRSKTTHSEYAIYIAFLLQQQLHNIAYVLRYTYIVWLVFTLA